MTNLIRDISDMIDSIENFITMIKDFVFMVIDFLPNDFQSILGIFVAILFLIMLLKVVRG